MEKSYLALSPRDSTASFFAAVRKATQEGSQFLCTLGPMCGCTVLFTGFNIVFLTLRFLLLVFLGKKEGRVGEQGW